MAKALNLNIDFATVNTHSIVVPAPPYTSAYTSLVWPDRCFRAGTLSLSV